MTSARSWPVFVVALVLYAATCSTTVQGGDAGEWMVLAASGGVGHPPGYPLWTLFVRILGAVPVGTVAFRASMGSALLAALAVALVHRSVWRLTLDGRAAWIAALALMLSGTFWRYATVAEVFAGAAASGALLVALAAEVHAGWRGSRAALALGVAFGLGLAHHHSIVFLLPLFGWALGRSGRPSSALVGVLPGLASYGLLMLPGGAWRWGSTSSLGGVARHVLRRDYGTLSLSGQDASVAFWEHPLDWAVALPWEWSFVFAVLALVGMLEARHPLGRSLSLSTLLAGPVFLALFDVPAEDLGRVVAARFHVLPAVLLAVLAGVGIASASRRWRRAPLVLAACLPVSFGLHVEFGSHRGWTLLEDVVVEVLESAEPDTTLVVHGDSMIFGLMYAQEVLGVRPDVTVYSPTLAEHDWYDVRPGASTQRTLNVTVPEEPSPRLRDLTWEGHVWLSLQPEQR